MIWNEFYRDQQLDTALTIDTTDGADTTTNTTLQNIAWEKDRFTSARPSEQLGTSVKLPLGTEAPIFGDNMDFDGTNDSANQVNVRDGSNNLRALNVSSFCIFLQCKLLSKFVDAS